MSDNTTLNAGTGGDVIASDDIGGVKHQRVKISIGADGAAADCSSANPLPVQLSASTATTEVVGDAAHDAAAAGNPVLAGGYASAAAPTDVSADGDAVRAWMLRNGAQATVITAAGALVGGDATNGLDVDVTRVIPGTSATHLGKAVDSVAGATDTGVAALFVRDDALTTLTPADGDYVPGRVDSVGNLHVRVSAGGIAGIADDAAFTPGTSEVLPVGFEADESSVDSVDEGDIGAARMSLDRKQYVIAHSETSTIYQNGTARTPVFLAIDAATSGNNTLLAAQGSGNKIRVHQLMLVAAGTVNVRFESGADGTALSGQMNLVANTGFVLPYSPIGWFETAANTLLNLELSGAVSVDGVLAYTVVT